MRLIKTFVFFLFAALQLNSLPAKTSEERPQGFSFDVNYRSLRVPVTITHNLVVVTMRINNSPQLNFILDTGVNTTILTEPLVAFAFDLNIDELIYVVGLGNEGIIEAGMSRNLTFYMPGITGHNMNLIVLPEGILSFSEIFGFPVHGIIGYDFFKEFPIQVNYRREFIRIYRNPTYRVRRRSRVIPMNIENNKPYIDVSVEGVNSKIDSLRLLVDLGATSPLFLNRRYRDLTPDRIPSYLGKGISGELKGETGRLKKITIDEFELKEPLASYPQEEFLTVANLQFDWEGIIGGGILNRFHVIIDYPSEKLILRRNPQYNTPFQTNMSGIEIIAKGIAFNNYVINHVRENSVAWEQGILPGDEIIRIDNEPASRLTLEEVIGYLNQNEGTTIRMELLRGDHIYRKAIRLREDI
ncbi:MAG: hypothetical protein EA361_06915 [Bacteroidetes bacterium]|nr:MAG: hypothetical protein EA361_06915 [Bacteroidota bacterium]